MKEFEEMKERLKLNEIKLGEHDHKISLLIKAKKHVTSLSNKKPNKSFDNPDLVANPIDVNA
jgi:hypothetical protein